MQTGWNNYGIDATYSYRTCVDGEITPGTVALSANGHVVLSDADDETVEDEIDPQVIEYQKLVDHYTTQIDKITISGMPSYEEHGRTVVLVDEHNLHHAINDLLNERYLGFDTESRPTFRKGQKSHGISIIQLSSVTSCYLFQMRHIKDPAPISKIIDHPQIYKIGVGLKADRSELKSNFHFHPAGLIDLAPIFRPLGRKNDAGSKQLVALTMGQRLRKSKKASTSNWSVEKLTPTQIQYASDDAFSSIDVYLKLRDVFKSYTKLLDNELLALLDL